MLMFSVYVLSLLYVGKEIKVNQWNITIDKISSIDSLSNIYDNDPNIVHWELSDDTLYLYTKEDSIRDELERIKYINSIEPFTPSDY